MYASSWRSVCRPAASSGAPLNWMSSEGAPAPCMAESNALDTPASVEVQARDRDRRQPRRGRAIAELAGIVVAPGPDRAVAIEREAVAESARAARDRDDVGE